MTPRPHGSESPLLALDALLALDEVMTTVAELKARVEELEAALETIRMGTNPGVETEAEAQDNPVLTRAVIHEVARRALRGSVPEETDV